MIIFNESSVYSNMRNAVVQLYFSVEVVRI